MPVSRQLMPRMCAVAVAADLVGHAVEQQRPVAERLERREDRLERRRSAPLVRPEVGRHRAVGAEHHDDQPLPARRRARLGDSRGSAAPTTNGRAAAEMPRSRRNSRRDQVRHGVASRDSSTLRAVRRPRHRSRSRRAAHWILKLDAANDCPQPLQRLARHTPPPAACHVVEQLPDERAVRLRVRRRRTRPRRARRSSFDRLPVARRYSPVASTGLLLSVVRNRPTAS